METYGYVIERLSAFDLMYLHSPKAPRGLGGTFRHASTCSNYARFAGPYMANNLYSLELALQARHEDKADLVCFGRPFSANPDLVERLQRNAPIAVASHSTLYGGPEGYTDGPARRRRDRGNAYRVRAGTPGSMLCSTPSRRTK
jgi:N-ethylmaleimide reductase